MVGEVVLPLLIGSVFGPPFVLNTIRLEYVRTVSFGDSWEGGYNDMSSVLFVTIKYIMLARKLSINLLIEGGI
jgi:hypothetical protein